MRATLIGHRITVIGGGQLFRRNAIKMPAFLLCSCSALATGKGSTNVKIVSSMLEVALEHSCRAKFVRSKWITGVERCYNGTCYTWKEQLGTVGTVQHGAIWSPTAHHCSAPLSICDRRAHRIRATFALSVIQWLRGAPVSLDTPSTLSLSWPCAWGPPFCRALASQLAAETQPIYSNK